MTGREHAPARVMALYQPVLSSLVLKSLDDLGSQDNNWRRNTGRCSAGLSPNSISSAPSISHRSSIDVGAEDAPL